VCRCRSTVLRGADIAPYDGPFFNEPSYLSVNFGLTLEHFIPADSSGLTLHPKFQTQPLNPSFLIPEPLTLNPQGSEEEGDDAEDGDGVNPKPLTLHPKTQTLNLTF